MSGIVGNGFMGRGGGDPCAPPSDWNYINDDISDGLHSWSTLKCRADYAVDPFRSGSNDIPFCANATDKNFLDGLSTNPAINAVRNHLYDAPGNGFFDGNTNAAKYNSADKKLIDFDLGANGYIQNSLLNPVLFQQAKSYVVVWQNKSLINAFRGLFYNGSASNNLLFCNYVTDGRIRVRYQAEAAGEGDLQTFYSGFNDLNLHIGILTHTGGNDTSDFDFYIDDMTTPATKNTTVNTLTKTTGDLQIVSMGCFLGSAGTQKYTGFIHGLHVWNKILNQTEREQVKAFYAQHYNF